MATIQILSDLHIEFRRGSPCPPLPMWWCWQATSLWWPNRWGVKQAFPDRPVTIAPDFLISTRFLIGQPHVQDPLFSGNQPVEAANPRRVTPTASGSTSWP